MIEVLNLSKKFNTERGVVQAIDEVSISVSGGRLVTLLGASGCGKTTLLRCLAGLEQPDAGTIKIDGKVVFSAETQHFEPPEYRPIGMVFQSYAIWPHMTVFENVAYPLLGKKMSKVDVAERVSQVLSQVDLTALADRPAPHLSGGQQQRVALARALISNPKVLLLDEPLSNLDARLRYQMRIEIRRLQRQSGVTTVYVTHDQDEAMAISDEIVFISRGRVIERGRPEEIYDEPKNKLTAEFFGEANFLRGKVKEQRGNSVAVEVAGGVLACSRGRGGVGEEVTVFFRPEDVHLVRQISPCDFYMPGTVFETVFLGKFVECSVELSDQCIVKSYVHRTFKPRIGEQVYLRTDPDRTSILLETA